ncbi:hypothetical protein AAIH60_34160, partial [Pseudomonas aeruginosa]|uniref:hypothetical protein n=1 Tax=Pseudomonas aeruginosa TaxID=287 RepID=UPI0031B7B75F
MQNNFLKFGFFLAVPIVAFCLVSAYFDFSYTDIGVPPIVFILLFLYRSRLKVLLAKLHKLFSLIVQNEFLKLVLFWAIFSITFSLVSAYFAFSYADVKDVNVGDLMEGDELSINKSFSFISDEECVSAKSVVYDFVKDKKSFPIY